MLFHVLEGQSNALIARYLGLTEATVKVHLKSLMRRQPDAGGDLGAGQPSRV
jgi:FixJ family two-component response regulator